MSASTATTAAAALAALPPSPLESGRPLRMLTHAAPLAEGRQQRQRGHAGRVARRVAGQPAVVVDDVVDADPLTAPNVRHHLVARRIRARSRARRSHSATLETVAGANAVTEIMRCRI